MENKKEIIGFICRDCNVKLDIGTCGNHREETDHKEFDPIYSENGVNYDM